MVQPTPGAADAPPIYTIGYGARTFDDFVAVLKTHHIEFLIDVRTAPYSRYKPEFSKDTLEPALKPRGIRYVFMGDALGGRPDDPDCYVEGKVDYARIQGKPFYQAGIARLRTAHEQHRRVALLCSEGKPEECHRAKLIGATLVAQGIAVRHIDEHDLLCTQDDIMHRLDGPQLTLFAEPTRASRKRYPAGKGAGKHPAEDPAGDPPTGEGQENRGQGQDTEDEQEG